MASKRGKQAAEIRKGFGTETGTCTSTQDLGVYKGPFDGKGRENLFPHHSTVAYIFSLLLSEQLFGNLNTMTAVSVLCPSSPFTSCFVPSQDGHAVHDMQKEDT